MVLYAVVGADEAIAIRPICQSRSRARPVIGAERREARERYPFVSGAISDIALTPSASAWKFITTR